MDDPTDRERWEQLLRKESAHSKDDIEMLQDLPAVIERYSVRGDLGPSLGSAAEILGTQLLATGLRCCDSEWNRLDAVWPGVIPALRATLERRNPLSVKGVIDYIDISQCAGRAVPAEAVALVEPALERVTQLLGLLTDFERYGLALAAIAFGRLDLVPKFASGGKLPKTFKPGQTFQFNMQAFIRYLAVAVQHGASPEDVEPAWRQFVALFPFQISSKGLTFVDLFTAARVMLVQFEKRDVGEVAQALHDFVREQ